ncbi:MAG: hypothetical protein GPJ54_03440 [Candidatus Heimdallarchaeota archaeon]|nr:hypothetical protein [Candidatus Heimdallarchaeota archaeon]
MIPLFVLLLVILSVGISIAAIVLILRKKEQTSQRLTWLLIGALSSAIIWIILTSLQIDTYSLENNLIGFAITAAISNIVIMLGIVFLSIFVNYLIRPRVDLIRIVIMTAILSFCVAMYAIMILAANNSDKELVELSLSFVNVANLILVVVYVSWVRIDFRILLAEDLPDKLRKYILRFYTASVIAFIGNFPIFILAWFVDQSYLGFSYLLLAIAMTIMVYSFLQDPRVAFILPERTYLAIMVNSFGGLQYSKNFLKGHNDSFTIIISGVLNAISGIMSEFYDTPVQPQLIQFEERQILLKWREGYFLAVFTDRDSPLIRTAMDQTVLQVENKFGIKLQKELSSPILMDLDDIFQRTFYFVIMT